MKARDVFIFGDNSQSMGSFQTQAIVVADYFEVCPYDYIN